MHQHVSINFQETSLSCRSFGDCVTSSSCSQTLPPLKHHPVSYVQVTHHTARCSGRCHLISKDLTLVSYASPLFPFFFGWMLTQDQHHSSATLYQGDSDTKQHPGVQPLSDKLCYLVMSPLMWLWQVGCGTHALGAASQHCRGT